MPRTLKQIRADLNFLAASDDKAKLLMQWWSKLDTPGTNTEIIVTSILSHRTHKGMVELAVNGEIVQMDLDKAREVHTMLTGAIEAAISDELIHRFMIERVGLEPEQASRALLDFREMRQGSRETVFPQ